MRRRRLGAKHLCGFAALLVLITLISAAFFVGDANNARSMAMRVMPAALMPSPSEPPLLPDGFTRVVATVFCCRPHFFAILDTYLQASLKINGGVLDEVYLLVNTDVPVDLEFIDTLNDTPGYQIVRHPDGTRPGYHKLYTALNDSSTLYLKIDDDVVFIDDGAIEALVRAYTAHRDAYCILSANVINHPRLNYYHQSVGALNDVHPSPSDGLGPIIYEDNPFGNCTLKQGRCVQRVHETFFAHVRANTLSAYSRGGDCRGIHNFTLSADPRVTAMYGAPVRWSINFFTMTKAILDSLGYFNATGLASSYPYKASDDELVISHLWPRDHHCYCGAVLNARVVHYNYGPQAGALRPTDFLHKYRMLAVERNGDPRGLLAPLIEAAAAAATNAPK